MLVIGLVGRIGAGKSTVAALFAARGGVVIDADRLAHEVLGEPEALAAVVRRFGPGVLDAAGQLCRAALAARVFGDGERYDVERRALEAIVHPRVRARIEGVLADVREAERCEGRRRVVVLDVPLLVQAGLDAICDRIVVVECDEDVRRARLASRGWSADQARARDRAWEAGSISTESSGKMTCVVDATGALAYTSARVDEIWASLTAE